MWEVIFFMAIYCIFTMIFHSININWYCIKLRIREIDFSRLILKIISKKLLFFLILPDYISADFFKSMRGSKSNKIKEWNRNNIIFGAIVGLAILALEFSSINIPRDSWEMRFILVF
ncbi:MAG: hypothetical protein ACRCZI_15020 [Cetobacterium sp.]